MPLQVILKKPVQGLGSEADIVKVKSGYARNYLFPKGMAALATDASKKQIETLKKQRAEREAQELNNAQELASKLQKATLTFQMKTGEEEGSRIFGSVTSHDIITRLAEMGYQIDKKHLILEKPIKTLGEHTVKVNLHQSVQTHLKVILDAPQGTKIEETDSKPKTKKIKKPKTKD